jgi:multiple antibiotic resistance protein
MWGMTIFSAALILFFVMDPLGNIPVFLSVLDRVPAQRRTRVLVRELSLALLILIFFLFIGKPFLGFLELEVESIRVAGGIVLFLIALRMIFPPRGGLVGETPDGEPLVFPLAVPLVAGPSALATLLLLVKSEPQRMTEWLIALGAAWLVTAVILTLSPLLLKVVGRRGLVAMERLMGMLLVMLSVQLTLQGIREFLVK